MRLLFCAEPFRPNRPDPDYAAEVAAAEACGFSTSLIDFEALVLSSDAQAAIRKVTPADEPETAIYRGWMLKPPQYAALYEALLGKGIRLINTPDAYVHCHHLPESYPIIEPYTPKTVWCKVNGGHIDTENLTPLLAPFADQPIMVKDFVKSRKHEWHQACFIPSASDRARVERVVNRFLELQGPDLNEGLVFRAFVPFEKLTDHSRSGMPLTKEFRLFFLDGQLLDVGEYWEEGDYRGIMPPLEPFASVARMVRSRFFTMDVAKREAGDWMIVELGDGQVSGLPDRLDVMYFYRRLQERTAGASGDQT